MTELPMACSLTAAEARERADEFRALAGTALVGRERSDGEVVLRFRAEDDVPERVRDLARRERECCPFLRIKVEQGGDQMSLRLGAGPESRAALDVFYELAGPA
jgi:hypothetical protein